MNQKLKKFCKPLLVALSLLTLITSTDAQPFAFQYGDLALGFRNIPGYVGLYECVADVGPATNFENQALGTTINITSYNASQLDPDTYSSLTNLDWSVTGCTPSAATFSGYPKDTLWVTVPRPSLGVPGSPPVRRQATVQAQAVANIDSILNGAVYISSGISSNQDNTATFVQELVSTSDGQNYSVWMEDGTYPSVGDLQDTGPDDTNLNIINLENTTVAPFTTALRSDLYELRPTGTVDPHTGLTSGVGYDVGYFQFNTDGSMTFTRSSPAPPPAPQIVSITRSGSLSTVFFTTASGSYTYTLYYTNSAGLNTAISNWPSSPTTLTGNGNTNSLTDTTTDTNRFYRIGAN
jgi:hypothetical protein